jgi:hypothetical protein
LLGNAALQRVGGDFGGLMIHKEFKSKPIAADGNS